MLPVQNNEYRLLWLSRHQRWLLHRIGVVLLLAMFSVNIYLQVERAPHMTPADSINRRHRPDHFGSKALWKTDEPLRNNGRIYYVDADNLDTGYLNELFVVLDRLGWQRAKAPSDDWQLLWRHAYLFTKNHMKPYLQNLKIGQKINKIPGSEAYINKGQLIRNWPTISGIPRSFHLPDEKRKFIEFAEKHPKKLWVQKSSQHRGVRIRSWHDVKIDLNLKLQGHFVQEYIGKPFLIDKRKFDMGVYTTVTSVRPLRAYVYDADTRLRFCNHDYEPFNANDPDKYVIGKQFTSTAQLPSMRVLLDDFGFTDKEALKSYMRSLGRNADEAYDKLYDQIRRVLLDKAAFMRSQLDKYAGRYGVRFHPRNFFELQRFDLIIDDDWNVYLMEVNMSPNLKVGVHADLKLIVQKLLYSLFSLVGIGQRTHVRAPMADDDEVRSMVGADNELRVYADECLNRTVAGAQPNCTDEQQMLCAPCLAGNAELHEALLSAHQEHVNRHGFRRVIPEPIPVDDPIRFNDTLYGDYLDGLPSLSALDRSLWWWFRGKCQQQLDWCN